jgi:2-oxoglutarate ferredoxin oxidoreductase subunit beta
VQALGALDFDMNRLVAVSGIGCTGRVAGYLLCDSFHTTHGRAIPFATGVKAAQPKLKVAVLSGDGDLFAIGGNHFIHAARRNVDMLVICNNNFNYGMTGGQLGPTTPPQALTNTSPYGHVEPSFNLVRLAAVAGATYVARWTALQTQQLIKSIQKCLQKPGFSFIEFIGPCPTYFGRYNRLRSPLEMMKNLQNVSVIKNKIDLAKTTMEWGPTDLDRPIIVGEFVDTLRPEYTEQLMRIGR